MLCVWSGSFLTDNRSIAQRRLAILQRSRPTVDGALKCAATNAKPAALRDALRTDIGGGPFELLPILFRSFPLPTSGRLRDRYLNLSRRRMGL
jgi:hypothetical protein